MHKVMKIIEALKVPISDRFACKSWVWDGHTLALRSKKMNFHGPQVDDFLTREALLHEICHWVVATEDERALPEYGMGAKPLFKGAVFRHESLYQKRTSKILELKDSQVRETAAICLNHRVGTALGIGLSDTLTIDRFFSIAREKFLNYEEVGLGWFDSVSLDFEKISSLMIDTGNS